MQATEQPRCTLVTTARNEGPYFLEWVAWHRMIGFDRILIFQNESDDGTDAILHRLNAMGVITYFYNRAKRGAHQVRAYKRAARQEAYRAADWAMALDMDEFLHIKVPGGRLPDLLRALPEADEVLLNWRVFGNGGHRGLTDALVTERFTRCDPAERIAGQVTGFKTLFRPGLFRQPGIHKPFAPDRDTRAIRTVNGSGLPASALEMRKWRANDPGQRALAQVNHYVLRDAASFVLKRWRGSAHQADRDLGERYWRRFNFHAGEDTGIMGKSPMIRDEMERLDRQSGGDLFRMRQAAIDHHRTRFEALMAEPDFARLYAYCLDDIDRTFPARAA